MAIINSYKELIVWQKGICLVEAVYYLTKSFPQEERYGITSQIKRAAVAIPSNISEGWGRRFTKEYLQFLAIANGSAAELDTQLILARCLRLGKDEQYEETEKFLVEIQKILATLIRKLKTKC